MRKTHEKFVEELYNINPNIITTEMYNGCNNKIGFKCLIDGYEWTAKPSLVLSKVSHCNICSGFLKSKDTFLKELNELDSGKNIDIISEYKGTHKKIRAKCKIDGFEWDTTPHNLLQEHGCRECQRLLLSDSHKIENEVYVNNIYKMNPNIEVIDSNIDSHSKIQVRCKKHNVIYRTNIYTLYKGCGCDKCKSEKIIFSKTKTNEVFVKQLYDLYGDEVIALDKYVGDKVIMRFRHKCGCVFSITPSSILQYLSCPGCNTKSKGENKICEILNKHQIYFIQQYSYDDLFGVGNKKLSYDFFLPKYNLLIEYQGVQHIKPVKYFGGEEQFIIQQEHDKRKRDYAKFNNIELLEIWYWDCDNIEQILNDKLHINNIEKSA